MENTQQCCRNCSTPLSGEFCSHCGQREGRPDIHLADAAGELIGDIFTRDSRLWRTLLNLVLRPGFLPAEFMAGRKARYVPPFRLYLIISFVLFLALSFGASIRVIDTPAATTYKQPVPANPASTQDSALAAESDEQGDVDLAIALGNPEEGEQQQRASLSIDLADENSPAWLQTLETRMEENAEELGEEPGAFLDLLIEYLPQMMFLLLPLFALLLKACYLFSPFHYIQHLVFAFYYHSFTYLLYLVGVMVEWLGVHSDGALLALFIIYLPLALRRSYTSSIGGALGKSLFILISYGILLLLGFALVTATALVLM